MGKGPRPEDWTETVRAHHPDAVAWVAAASEPCLTIRDEEISNVKRILQGAGFGNLPDRDALPSSWLLAIIVCPGDDLEPVIRWALALDEGDRGRVQLYYHPDVDLPDILDAWLEAGLPEPVTYQVQDFATFHNQFGWEFNDQVYRDATGWTPP